jgi:rhodanese-related sulfurtransferase
MAIESPVKPNNPSQAKAYFENKMQFTTGPVELERMLSQKQTLVVVDVREEEDYRQGHIPGAINLQESKWGNPTGLDKNKQNVVYCYSHVCHLGAKAAKHLAQAGYPVMEMDGGWASWQEHGLPTAR